MPYQDLQAFIKDVETFGELHRLFGVSADLEIGVLTEYAARQSGTPALLFEDIPGYPGGRILTNGLRTPRRLGRVLGLGDTKTEAEAVNGWRRRLGERSGVPVRHVAEGPVLSRVTMGPDIDLLQFPAPHWHLEDGGRYIGTADVIINADVSSGFVNLGTYRVMVQGRDTVSIYISPGHHGRLIRERWFQAGKPCPVAIVLGADPALFVASRSPMPWGMSEYEFAGWIRGEPVEVIKGPTTGLPIPAHAELVIEGQILPNETCQEGPFGEFTGYYAGGFQEVPKVQVTAVLQRDHPVIYGSPPQKPPAESTFVTSVLRSATIWNDLERNGIQEVRGVWMLPAAAQFITVVSMHPKFGGQAKQAGYLASSCLGGAFLGRFVVVVDSDIDPTDVNEVLWALGTRTDAEHGLEILHGAWSSPLDPSMPPDKRDARDFTNTRVVIDATRPYHWRERFPKMSSSTPEVMEQVLAKWGSQLGF